MEKLRKTLSLVAIVLLIWSCEKKEPQPEPEPEPQLNLSLSEKSISNSAAEFDITVQANCEWTITKDAEWLSLLPDVEHHALTATITIRVTENHTLLERSAVIRFLYGSETKELTIRQDAIKVYLNVSLGNISFGYRTAEKVFTVTSNCGWEAKSTASWLAIRPSTGLIGSFEMTVNAETNNNNEPREAQICIWNEEFQLERTVTVTQDGQPHIEDKDYIDENGVNHGKGTTIRGLSWAPVNCGYSEDTYPIGKMYQWGRKWGLGYQDETYTDDTAPTIAGTWDGKNGEDNPDSFYCYSDDSRFSYDWIIEGSDSFWNLGSEENPVKNNAYDPCPEGWRVPTAFEFKSLIEYIDRNWITSESGWNGYLFSESKADAQAKLFLPAGGRLNVVDGQAVDRNIEAYYWTITALEGNSSYLYFHRDACNVNAKGSRAGGCLIRCIKE